MAWLEERGITTPDYIYLVGDSYKISLIKGNHGSIGKGLILITLRTELGHVDRLHHSDLRRFVVAGKFLAQFL